MAQKLNIPIQTVPIVDPKTGLVNEDWYRFLKFLTDKINTAGL